jgi:hypothetical protein
MVYELAVTPPLVVTVTGEVVEEPLTSVHVICMADCTIIEPATQPRLTLIELVKPTKLVPPIVKTPVPAGGHAVIGPVPRQSVLTRLVMVGADANQIETHDNNEQVNNDCRLRMSVTISQIELILLSSTTISGNMN